MPETEAPASLHPVAAAWPARSSGDELTAKLGDEEHAEPEREAPAIPDEWLAEFEAASRRPLEQYMRYAFIRTYGPVLDDAGCCFSYTMRAYRRWCEDTSHTQLRQSTIMEPRR